MQKKEKVYHYFEKEGGKPIKFLSFEGGGGKGVAFLGAIAALEKENRLKDIEGISGASAGAITAFLLALGYDTMGIAEKLSKSETFIGFYDGPLTGKTRAVKNNISGIASSGQFKNNKTTGEMDFRFFSNEEFKDYPWIIKDAINSFPQHKYLTGAFFVSFFFGIPSLVAGLSRDANDDLDLTKLLVGGGGGFTSIALLTYLLKYLTLPVIKTQVRKAGIKEDCDTKEKSETPFKALLDIITDNKDTFYNYITNVLLDRGLFPGFKLREFFLNALNDKNLSPTNNLNFNDFESKFEKDLRIVSVNSTTHRPQIFSIEKTPDFPVVDAVGMSSSFPFAFKPVLVMDCQKDGEGPENGYYLDGGLVNNLPMHLFDDNPVSKLDENMFAIRLEYSNPEQGIKEVKECDKSSFDILSEHAGDLLNSALFYSEEGQIRTKNEREQTVELDVSGLETLQFVAPIEKSAPKILEAYVKTRYSLDKGYKINGVFEPSNNYYSVNEGEVEDINPNNYYDFTKKDFKTYINKKMDVMDKDDKGKMLLKLMEIILNDGDLKTMLDTVGNK